ncbi:putative reverse transcriptase, partial [Operophtera brumata]
MICTFYQNVNRIRSKIKDVYLNASANNYDLICLTESNLNDSVMDGELFDARYNVFRRDRLSTKVPKKEGGGLLIASNKKLRVDWESDVEDIWLTLLSCDHHKPDLNVCLCYLPPDWPVHLLKSFYDNLHRVIFNSKDSDEFLVLGDFNTPLVTWTPS